MVRVDLLLALGLLPLFLVRSPDWLWVVYIVAFVQSCLSQFFGPAENALLPKLVAEEDLLQANALNSLNNNLARLIGPSVGGLVAAWGGLSGIAAVDCVSFLVAALLIQLISVDEPRRASDDTSALSPWRSVWNELVAGFEVVRHHRLLRVMFGLLAITGLGEGVFSVLIVAFVSTVLGGTALELGWLMAAQAVGGLLGGLFVGAVARRVPTVRLIGLGSVAFGLIDLAIFNYPALNMTFLPAIWIGIALFVLVGIPGVWTQSAIQTLLQSSVPDAYLGRVFGTLGAILGVLGLIGTLIAGFSGERLGIVTVLNIQGAGYVVAGLLALVLLREVVARQLSAVSSQ
jgi:MFS family permease